MKRIRNPETGRIFHDLTGDTFGRWTVLGLFGKRGQQTTWRCQCECGRIKDDVNYGGLTAGVSNSCGCLRSEQLRSMSTVHGRSKGRIYHIWQQMKVRCYDPTRRSWKDYGGRGIKVCQRWLDSFQNFLADMGEAPYGESIDRINNDGDYEPGNCRWATRQEQQRNRRSNQWFEWKGEKRTVTDIARMENVAFCSFRNRIFGTSTSRGGDSPEQAVAYCRARGLTFRERALCMMDP